MKEAFIENQLDKFQPGWRNGQDITAETKRKIKEYAFSKMPEELLESEHCITDYSIWHMTRKIRERENLSKPQRSNKGKKVSERQPVEEKTITQGDPPTQKYRLRDGEDVSDSDPDNGQPSKYVSVNAKAHANIIEAFRQLIMQYGVDEFMAAIIAIANDIQTSEEGKEHIQSKGSEKGET